MDTFVYNDISFCLQAAGEAWNIVRTLPDGSVAPVGAGLFEGACAELALPRARALVKAIFPVGVGIVAPDVNHPTRIGEQRFVGPDVRHAHFIQWDRDSSSFPKRS